MSKAPKKRKQKKTRYDHPRRLESETRLQTQRSYQKLSWIKIALIILIVSPVILILAIKLLRDWEPFIVPDMHLSGTNWEYMSGGLVERKHGPDCLLIMMKNETSGFNLPYTRILSLDPGDGRTHGQFVHNRWSLLLGVTRGEAWVQKPAGKGKKITGLALPSLKKRYQHDDLFRKKQLGGMIEKVSVDGMDGDLRVAALDGRSYRLAPRTGAVEKLSLDVAPPRPTLLNQWRERRCRWKTRGPLFDCRGCKPIKLGNDRLTVDYYKKSGSAYSTFARILPNGKKRWEIPEEKIFGSFDDEGLFRTIRFSTLFKDLLLIVCGDGDDLYVAGIDVNSGDIRWARTFW